MNMKQVTMMMRVLNKDKDSAVIKLERLLEEDSLFLNVKEHLFSGGLIVAPTETRYGILGRADLPDVIDNLYTIKNRERNLPLSLFVSSLSQLWETGKKTRTAELLAKKFLPGPLTLVLENKSSVDKRIILNGKVGIRLSSSLLIQKLTRSLGIPLSATSANISGEKELSSIQEIYDAFGRGIDYYIDSGLLTGETSTVVDCTKDEVIIIREGKIKTAEIEKAVIES